MKTKNIPLILLILGILSACQRATPSPDISASVDTEFTLAPEQSAAIRSTDLTITFHSVISDDRCPSDVECVASGPVTISLSVQQENDAASKMTLQTFTDNNGLSPKVEFEGIQDRVEVGDYLLQVVGVLPYPQSSSEIKASDYRVTLMVTSK